MSRDITVGLNAVIFSVRDDEPRVLTVADASELPMLPSGALDPESDRTLELGLRGWVRHQTGRELGYVEQLYTFADQGRDPRERAGGPRMLSVAYLALTQDLPAEAAGGHWMGCYGFLPWEDWRHERPAVLDEIGQALDAWARQARSGAERERRAERSAVPGGTVIASWSDTNCFTAPASPTSHGSTRGASRPPLRACSASPWRTTIGASWPPASPACAASCATARWYSS